MPRQELSLCERQSWNFPRWPWRLGEFSSTYTPVYVVCLIDVQSLEIIEARLRPGMYIAGLSRLGDHALDGVDIVKLLGWR